MASSNSTANLIKQADILTNLLLTDSIDGNLTDLADFFKDLCDIPASNEIYGQSEMWCFAYVLNKISCSSTILDTLKTFLDNNLLIHKIYFYKELSEEINEINTRNEIEIRRNILKTPNDEEKIVVTTEINTKTGETKELERQVLKKPTDLSLESIFKGLINEELNKEQNKKE